jgi:hypothetical protein
MDFYASATGFMWEDKNRKEFLSGTVAPKFKMTISKAFELVALFGPVLYWRNPEREIRPRSQFTLRPELFGDPQEPQSQQAFQQAQAEQAHEQSLSATRDELMQMYLNYSPTEQPGGGLASHSELAITEALVKGRGCLWTEPYQMPGSERVLTGCFYDSVDNLLIDPDCTDPTLSDAQWIAKRCTAPYWKVEEEFKLPKNSLRNRGTYESGESQGARKTDSDHNDRQQGRTNDLIVYHKIWSKAGVGTRLTQTLPDLAKAFDDVVGDFAYIVIAEGIDYPLNAPSSRVRLMKDEQVKKMFAWPVPYYADDEWPVSLLDFYRKPNSAWPIAPLSPGLGELIFLNVMMSHLSNRIWSSSRDFIAVLKSASSQIKATIAEGEDLAVLEIEGSFNKRIDEVVQFLQQPQVNFDVWRIIEKVSENFDKRVGLTELAYGLNSGAQSRSATDTNIKQENMSVRPDYMAGKVEQWQEQVADKEKFCAHWFVEGRDLQPLLGRHGSQFWDQLISKEDPEIVVREMRATVTAGSARKPNKARDTQNISSVLPIIFPELSKHADMTGDTQPLNAMLRQWGEAIDMDVSGIQMGQRAPSPPSEEEQQIQQQQQQMEMQQQQAELAKVQAETQGKQVDAASKQAQAQADAQQGQTEELSRKMDLMFDEASHSQDQIQDQETHQQSMFQRTQDHRQKLGQDEEAHDQKMTLTQAEARVKNQITSQATRSQQQARPAQRTAQQGAK